MNNLLLKNSNLHARHIRERQGICSYHACHFGKDKALIYCTSITQQERSCFRQL